MRIVFLCLILIDLLFAPFAYADDNARDFATTLQTDDADVDDEIILPYIRAFKENDGDAATWRYDYNAQISKRLTDRLALLLGGSYIDHDHAAGGFGNVGAGLKYKFYDDDRHALRLAASLNMTIGGTGSPRIENDNFSTFIPSASFSKGMDDLPDNMQWLRPLAITGSAGVAVPSSGHSMELDPASGINQSTRNPTTLLYGFSLQYDLRDVERSVKGGSIAKPYDHLVPIIEFQFESDLSGGDTITKGTINPGLSWQGEHGTDIGVEAVLPLNRESGSGVGMTVQLHMDLETLIPGAENPIF